jgi:uncharacterized protein (DUF4415 family)
MKQTAAEARRRIDFSTAKRGAVVKPQRGKTKISIRLDNDVLEHFRAIVQDAGGGNYQSLINDALRAFIQQKSIVRATRDAVKEELSRSALNQANQREAIEATLRRVLREEATPYRVGKVRAR